MKYLIEMPDDWRGVDLRLDEDLEKAITNAKEVIEIKLSDKVERFFAGKDCAKVNGISSTLYSVKNPVLE